MAVLTRLGGVAVVALLCVVPAVPQGAKKPLTLAEEKQALLGDWKMVVNVAGDSVQTKLRFTDRDLRMFILSQSSTNLNLGGPHFEYHVVEKQGQRLLVLSLANRDETVQEVKYQLDGDKLRLSGAGVVLNKRTYDLSGEWTRVKKKS